MGREIVSSNTRWESIVGYSRAIKVGSIIDVSGTTATDSNGKILYKDDPYMQTVQAIQNIEASLKKLNSSLEDVTRTRIYVKNIDSWEQIARGHSKFFSKIKPTTSMVEVSRFIDSDILVEIEAQAITE